MDVEEKIKHQYTYEKMIIKYFEDKLNMSNKEINQFHFKHGDIAKIVLTDNNFYTLVPNYRKNDEKKLTIDEIYNYKEKIMNITGNNSNELKLREFDLLIRKSCIDIEALFITRLFLNKLNIGLQEKGVIAAVLNLNKENKENKVIKDDKKETKTNKDRKETKDQKETKENKDIAYDLIEDNDLNKSNRKYSQLISYLEAEIFNYRITKSKNEAKLVPGILTLIKYCYYCYC